MNKLFPEGVPATIGMPLPSTLAAIAAAPKRESQWRPLSAAEVEHVIDARATAISTFVPQMLSALAVDQVSELCDFCAARRISGLKSHCRRLRRLCEEYNRSLCYAYGPAYEAYVRYRNRLRESVATDMFKSWVTYCNEASRQGVGLDSTANECRARISFCVNILCSVFVYNQKTDAEISRRLGHRVESNTDGSLALIIALLGDMSSLSGRFKPTSDMSLCVKILTNRCRQVAETIIDEEDRLRNASVKS